MSDATDLGGDPSGEEEIRRKALECLLRGWQEALDGGVDPQTVAITALSTGLTGLVDVLGKDGARMVAEQLPEQIEAGYFSPRNEQN